MNLVVDASVWLELLVSRTRRSAIAQRLRRSEGDWLAPAHVDLELAQVLGKAIRTRRLERPVGDAAWARFRRIELRRFPLLDLAPRIWALRDAISAYDAAYIALAEREGAVLLTCDERLARTVGHQATIEVLTSPR